jgi:precorrin-2 dehydrogenase/sirohydrochlorin ferrochelatase
MIPLLHDFEDERVLVVGGGRVGARKARRFAREATVVVLSPAFADESFGGAERVRAAPTPDGIGAWIDRMDPALVVAATDDERLNAATERAARDRGLLVNRADRSEGHDPGDVAVPATVRDDPVVVALATGATSPALSRYLRQEIEAEFDGAGVVATATAAVRERLDDRELDPDVRRRTLRRVVAADQVWDAARSSSAGAAETDAQDVAEDVLSRTDRE